MPGAAVGGAGSALPAGRRMLGFEFSVGWGGRPGSGAAFGVSSAFHGLKLCPAAASGLAEPGDKGEERRVGGLGCGGCRGAGAPGFSVRGAMCNGLPARAFGERAAPGSRRRVWEQERVE